jgi:YetA-like protein
VSVAQLPVRLTIQEAIYPGAPTSGINRIQDPVTVGIPLADSEGITSISQLGLQHAAIAQFRVLGRWPSGNIKWVLVDTQADLAAGGKNTAIALTHGTGNFGGLPLASDGGSTITVDTGVAVFTIRKANFNVFDQVVSSGRALVVSGGSQGLAILGPENPGTSCSRGPCKTLYLSSNDQSSTAAIEENGPVRAVIRADGVHRDAAGHPYMRFTVRMQFYKNKTFVKLTSILRNADEGASNTFNSAAKGFTSYEMRITPTLASDRTFAFGNDSGVVSGEFAGSENAYLYQAYSSDMEHPHWNSSTCLYGSKVPRCIAPYIRRSGDSPPYLYAQDGFQIVHGNKVLANEGHTVYPQGWAGVTDNTGGGVEVGIYQLSAYWPKSLQFQDGGSEIRIGIWPNQNLSPVNAQAAIPYYQAWPQYSVHDLYVNFHATALSSPGSEFLKYQHYLLTRAPIAHYNNTQVFAYPLMDPAEEDRYWTSLSSRYDFHWNSNSSAIGDKSPKAFRLYAWPSAGGSNQSEVRWGYIEQWLARGLAGRYLTAAQFYRYQTEQAFPRSDTSESGSGTFRWRGHAPTSDLDGFGFPANVQSANAAYVNRTWIDQEHAHWYGMGDFYFLTGDETIKDQMLDGVGDRFLNPSTILNTGHLWNTRAVGAQLMGLARYRNFLSSIGDTTDVTRLDAIADATLKASVFPELCVSGYPAGCEPKPIPFRGVSRTRGLASGGNDVGSDNNCAAGKGVNIRCAKPWMMAIEEQGLWEIAHARGPSWPNNQTGMPNPYQLTLDLAYGMASWTSNEDFVSGSSYRDSSLKYDLAMDYANPMTTPTPGTDDLAQFEFNYFLLSQYQGRLTAAQRRQFELTYLHMAAGTSFNPNNIDDHDMYVTSALLESMLHPWGELRTIPLTVSNIGPGSYSLSWTAPLGAKCYRVKISNQPIVDWIGFDPKLNEFVGNPVSSVNWFAASEVTIGKQSTCPPPPGSAGTHQSCTISGVDPNQAWHFAIKAEEVAASSDHPVSSIPEPRTK